MAVQADKQLVVVALAAVGAVIVLADFLSQLDRIRMAVVTREELDHLETTTDDGEG